MRKEREKDFLNRRMGLGSPKHTPPSFSVFRPNIPASVNKGLWESSSQPAGVGPPPPQSAFPSPALGVEEHVLYVLLSCKLLTGPWMQVNHDLFLLHLLVA